MCEEISIYVADLAAYNDGKLHGVRIDMTKNLDDIQDQINQMLEASPLGCAEEYAIHDYEGFGEYVVGEYERIPFVHKIACFIKEYPDLADKLLDYLDGNLDDARKAMEENYSGCYQSLADYARILTEETSQIPDNLVYYIDYELMGRDMELSGDVYTIETAPDEVHIFWSH